MCRHRAPRRPQPLSFAAGLVLAGLALIPPFPSPARAAAAQAAETEAPAAPQSPMAQLQALYERTPPCAVAGAADERDWLLGWARKVGIEGVEVKAGSVERVYLDEGIPTPIELQRLEVSGRAAFGDVYGFLARTSFRHRLIDLEGLTVEPQARGRVRFAARLSFPCHAGEPGILDESPEAMVANFQARLQETYDKVREVTVRSNPALVLETLARFDRLSEKRPLGLTAFRLDEGEVELEGEILAPAAQASLRRDLESAGFRVTAESMEPSGACQKLSVKARVEPRESTHGEGGIEEIVTFHDLFDARARELCAEAAAPSPSHRIAARGTAPAGSGLTLHLWAVDLDDVFLILHDLTGESFLVDAGVKGRIDAEIEGATLEEVLAALGGAGIRVSPGPLRRVSAAGAPEVGTGPGKGPYTGEPLDIDVQDAEMAEILCSFGLVSQSEISIPKDLPGTVNVFAKNVPSDQLLEALVAAAGLASKVEQAGLFIGPAAMVKDPVRRGAFRSCNAPPDQSAAGPTVRSRIEARLDGSGALGTQSFEELELAALARTGESWKAYVYATYGHFLRALNPGGDLADAKVTAVGAEGAAVTTPGGEVVSLRLRK